MLNGQTAMATAERSEVRESSVFFGRLLGFVIVAILPTMFWVALICGLAWASDRPLSLGAAAIISAVLFAFLSCIWASFAMADQQSPTE